MIIDYRCPKCDSCLKGTHSVVTVKSVPKNSPSNCKRCKAKVKLVEDTSGDRLTRMAGGMWYFSTTR